MQEKFNVLKVVKTCKEKSCDDSIAITNGTCLLVEQTTKQDLTVKKWKKVNAAGSIRKQRTVTTF